VQGASIRASLGAGLQNPAAGTACRDWQKKPPAGCTGDVVVHVTLHPPAGTSCGLAQKKPAAGTACCIIWRAA